MNFLKSILVGFFSFLFVMFLLYLVGAFGHADFNILNWDGDARGAIAAFGGVIAFTCGGALGIYTYTEKK